MSSNPPARVRRLWSLRARLLLGQIVVLAVACIGIGVVTELALHQYLMGQLDDELGKVAHRSGDIYGVPPPPPPPWAHHPHQYPRPGPGPDFLDAPAQPVGMVAAVINDGATVGAGFLNGDGSRVALTPTAATQLGASAADRGPVTRDLDRLGRYRIVTSHTRHGGHTIVTGLPMTNVDDTMVRVLMIFGAVTLVAVAAATTAGIVIIRRALAPLQRVAQTAGEVVKRRRHGGVVDVELALYLQLRRHNVQPATGTSRIRSCAPRRGTLRRRLLERTGLRHRVIHRRRYRTA